MTVSASDEKSTTYKNLEALLGLKKEKKVSDVKEIDPIQQENIPKVIKGSLTIILVLISLPLIIFTGIYYFKEQSVINELKEFIVAIDVIISGIWGVVLGFFFSRKE